VFRGIASGGAASTVLCAANDATLFLVDVGLDAEVADVEAADAASHVIVLHEKIRPGSQDMVEGPAMSEEEVAAAEGVGRGAVDAAVMLAAGEGAKPSELALCIGEVSSADGLH